MRQTLNLIKIFCLTLLIVNMVHITLSAAETSYTSLPITTPAAPPVVISKISPAHEDSFSYWHKTNRMMSKQLKIPFFFNIPYSAFSELPENLVNSRTSSSPDAPILLNYRESSKAQHTHSAQNDLGLRLIITRGANRTNSSAALAESGLFQTGDIVLSFRPEWFGTLRYSHIQLGVSHAGILYFQKGADGKRYLKNLDMPLDSKHVGEGLLNSEHYMSAPFLHIVRAKNLTDLQKSNLEKWLELMAAVGPKAYADGKIRFNQDYAAPKYKENEALSFVGDLARIALGINNKQQLTNYCSEFVWSLLSLRDCDPSSDSIRKDFATSGAPTCIKEIFSPMPTLGTIASNENLTLGLADGVPLILKNQYSYMSNQERRIQRQHIQINKSVFGSATGKGENISSGHRSVEEMLEKINPKFFDYLSSYFKLLMLPNAEQNPEVLQIRSIFNSSMARNYSPTSFIVHAILPPTSSAKTMDYIGTIHFSGKIRTRNGTADAYDVLRKLNID